MTLNEYQSKAMSTCMDSCDNFAYMFIGMVGEVGEIASKVAKLIRKEKAIIDKNDLRKYPNMTCLTPADEEELISEVGDVLWFVAGICNSFGWDLESIAKYNLEKLADRKKRGVIDGSGDHR